MNPLLFFTITLASTLGFQNVMGTWEKHLFFEPTVKKAIGCKRGTLLGTLNEHNVTIWNSDKKLQHSFDRKSTIMYNNQEQTKQLEYFEFSADGKLLAIVYLCTETSDYLIDFYSTATWKCIKTIESSFLDSYMFSPSGNYFCTSIMDILRIYDCKNFDADPIVIDKATDYTVLSREVSPGIFHEKIAYRKDIGSAKILNLLTKTRIKLKDPSTGFSPDGRFAILSPKQTDETVKTFKLLDLDKKISTIKIKTKDKQPAIVISPDSKYYALFDKSLNHLTCYALCNEPNNETSNIKSFKGNQSGFGFSPRSRFFWVFYRSNKTLHLVELQGKNSTKFEDVLEFNFYNQDRMLIIKHSKGFFSVFLDT